MQVEVLVHSSKMIRRRTLEAWLNPALYPQIVKFEWSAVRTGKAIRARSHRPEVPRRDRQLREGLQPLVQHSQDVLFLASAPEDLQRAPLRRVVSADLHSSCGPC